MLSKQRDWGCRSKYYGRPQVTVTETGSQANKVLQIMVENNIKALFFMLF